MRAGELRHRVTLQKPTKSRDSFNEMAAVSYSDVDTVWAAVEWRNGRRYLEASQLNSEVQGVVRIRYRTDVKADWRLKYGPRYLQILSMSNTYERDRELQLNCKEAQD